jgi:MFS family permease
LAGEFYADDSPGGEVNLGKQIAYARAISSVGDSFTTLAFPIAVLAIHQNPRDLALSETFGTLGMFTGSLLTPLFIDRLPRIFALLLSDLFALACGLVLIIGNLNSSLPILFAAYFFARAITNFHLAALDAVTADILREERKPLVAGFSRLQLFIVSAGILGGLSAAQVVEKIPLWSLLAIDAVSFLVSSSWILWILKSSPIARARPMPSKNPNPFSDWLEGFRAAFVNREVIKHVSAQGMLGIAFGITSSTVRAHLLGTLLIPISLFAYLSPSIRFFGFLGAALNTQIASRWKVKHIAYTGIIGMCVGYSGLGWINNFFLFLAFFGIQQFGNALVVPVNRALIMGNISSSQRGRVAAFRTMVIDASTIVGQVLSVWMMNFGTGFALKVLPFISGVVFLLYFFVKDWEVDKEFR